MSEREQPAPTEPAADPSRLAEDHRLRSRHMEALIREAGPAEEPGSRAEIPLVVVQFWHDAAAVPDDVRECLDSWEILMHQGFQRAFFDDDRARRFIEERFGCQHVAAFDQCHHPAMRCDYFRLCYIYIHGRFYVDADEVYQGRDCRPLFRDGRLKIQPLCYDVSSGTMVRPDVFMRSEASSPDWIYYVNNNPLIAPAGHAVIGLALNRATRILLGPDAGRHDIQSTTGPGNLTASLVEHSITAGSSGKARDFVLLSDWESMSVSRWPLSYRNDERNWRRWTSGDPTQP